MIDYILDIIIKLVYSKRIKVIKCRAFLHCNLYILYISM